MTIGIVGNCSYSALIEAGRIRWMCWPRFDSSFVFGGLLDGKLGGLFEVDGVGTTSVEQAYMENTNVLRTVFTGQGGSFELLDFAPRYRLYERFFKPTSIVRILRPLAGEPLVRVRCEPAYDYGRAEISSWQASNHIQYQGTPLPLRLTTNLPLSHVAEGSPTILDRSRHLVLTWGEPLESPLQETAELFLERTVDYWREWVKSVRIPKLFQAEAIRSALVLKLHQYEDTGAIIASTTTSLPEYPGSGRNWDYRFCWLRDAYFSLGAFENMGHFGEMERFLLYLRTICETHGDDLQPVYGISGESRLVEQVLPHLEGFRGDGPVRVGNQACEHVQNDVYGEMILAVSRILLDTRFACVDGLSGAVSLVRTLLAQIDGRLEERDAGPWELRGSQHLHTFTLLTHWVGARRAAEIGTKIEDVALSQHGRNIEARARELLMTRCWNSDPGVLMQHADSTSVDASSLLALHFGFFAPDSPEAASHVDTIAARLRTDGLLRRYDCRDDFGEPEAAFTVCSFWLVEALAMIGREDEAHALFERVLTHANDLGLLSEDILPATGELTGNFPQTYSHVGLLNAAFRISPPWD